MIACRNQCARVPTLRARAKSPPAAAPRARPENRHHMILAGISPMGGLAAGPWGTIPTDLGVLQWLDLWRDGCSPVGQPPEVA